MVVVEFFNPMGEKVKLSNDHIREIFSSALIHISTRYAADLEGIEVSVRRPADSGDQVADFFPPLNFIEETAAAGASHPYLPLGHSMVFTPGYGGSDNLRNLRGTVVSSAIE